MKKLIPIVLLSALCFSAQASDPENQVVANIDATKTSTPISPYVYGQFVEHIGNIIYDGMWSEMLDDRKFYFPVQPAPEEPKDESNPWRRKVEAGRWNPLGPVDSVTMDTEHAFSGDHSPVIQLTGEEPRGIRQTGLKLKEGVTYEGRIQIAGDSSAKVVISIVWEGGDEAVTQIIKLGKLKSDYKKKTFSFTAERTGTASFEIIGIGEGSFRVGAVSLMPEDNLEGWKPDAIAALKSLHSGVYRFPGGNFVSAHEWRDAIGDPDKRPTIMDPVWHAIQTNDIGTDEFLTMCRLLEVDPYISVNAGLGDAWSAAQYVEYTNSPVDTPMGKLRAENGHPEPYDVKFWGIGNEMWGDYQFGYMPLDHYVFKHNQFAKAMRKVDPSIVLIASGAMPDTMTGAKQALIIANELIPDYFSKADWTGALLKGCFDNFELISEHFYNFGQTHFDLEKAEQVPNDPNEPITDWMRRPANHIRIKYEAYKAYEALMPELVENPKPLNIDEWAYTPGPLPSYPAYAWVFHEIFRYPDIMPMAAHTFATALIVRDENDQATLNANGLVFKIYRDHFGTIPVEVTGNSPQPKPTQPPGGEQPIVNAGSDTFPLDVVAAWTEDRSTLTIAILNPTDVEQSLDLNLSGADLQGEGTLWRLASEAEDGKNPTISSADIAEVPAHFALPRFSISIYEFPVK